MSWAPDDGAGTWDTGEGPSDVHASSFEDQNANPNVKGTQGGWGGHDYDAAGPAKPQNSDNKCRNCGADDHFARYCPEPRKEMACFNCGQEGHSKAECPEPAKPRACFNCGQDGHTKAECPEPLKGMACYNCGEEGHTKAECIKPRVFKGPCRICEKEGHPAAECPERPPDICKNCKAEGHKAQDCKENRKFNLDGILEMSPEEAWALLKKASDERDLEDFREGFKVYSKAAPDATFVDIERLMREQKFNVYLIAMEKEIGDVRSLINLQGKLDCQYVVGFYYSSKAQRAHLRDRWPASVEENLERLADAGFPYDRQIPKCANCGEMGHIARFCKEEHISSYERIEVKCYNCNEVGHRVRDCPKPRFDKFACRNCGSSEHKVADCTKPRSAEGLECRRCNEVGHFAKDCPQASAPRTCRNCGSEDHVAKECDKPRDPSTVTCHNCDEVGHFSRDCTKKRDYSRVQCRECGEMGHTVKRCPKVQSGGDTNGAGDSGPAARSTWDNEDKPVDGGWGEGDATNQESQAADGDDGGWGTGGGGGW